MLQYETLCSVPFIDIGYKVMVSCGEKIVEGLSRNSKDIALLLLAKELILIDVYKKIIELNETNTDRARRLHLKVLKVVEQSPEKYDVFVDVFQQQKNQLCEDVVLALNQSYNQHGMTNVFPVFWHISFLIQQRKKGTSIDIQKKLFPKMVALFEVILLLHQTLAPHPIVQCPSVLLLHRLPH